MRLKELEIYGCGSTWGNGERQVENIWLIVPWGALTKYADFPTVGKYFVLNILLSKREAKSTELTLNKNTTKLRV